MVGSASFEEGAAGTMPAQVCATLMYNVLSSINGFSTPATVTFTPVGAGGAGKYLAIRSTKLRVEWESTSVTHICSLLS